MEKEKETSIGNWRDEITDAPAIFKVLDEETKTIVFMSEGKLKNHPDFGDSIVFDVEHEKEPKLFFVNANNFDLLDQIKEIGTLTGKAVDVSRVGSTKSNTRYTIKQIE